MIGKVEERMVVPGIPPTPLEVAAKKSFEALAAMDCFSALRSDELDNVRFMVNQNPT